MKEISVVFIARNEAHILGDTIRSLQGLTNDVVVADTGSTDNTMEIARAMGARAFSIGWDGFGKSKNKALQLARYDWVLFLDADESIDEGLKQCLLQNDFTDPSIVYKVRVKNYAGGKEIRFGEWRNERKVKFFNRRYARWDDAEVHEKVVVPVNGGTRTLNGFVRHYPLRDTREYAEKMNRYGELMAHRYLRDGKKASFFKLYLYPASRFILNYFFRLGFLDGRVGFTTATLNSYYAFLKYHRLKELQEGARETGISSYLRHYAQDSGHPNRVYR
ncbi:glycosyltransferase family 2 protein [Flavihumibacter rivuli]|uniref:glycosyltransferase family 2 protein n=1 Tax=Flavihumibacter rivuli TaxID=2838156 RepID=UPI001BDE6703|nr:glycosyltransferase family 2 protein [Flavihumibacter rivuli]ULQ57194.1 glycosyltransferase family 2 protein [Flavihumibacter rivuli]